MFLFPYSIKLFYRNINKKSIFSFQTLDILLKYDKIQCHVTGGADERICG